MRGGGSKMHAGGSKRVAGGSTWVLVCRKRVPVGRDAWLGSKTGAGALNMRASVSKMGAGGI